jgi:hypothetical protein
MRLSAGVLVLAGFFLVSPALAQQPPSDVIVPNGLPEPPPPVDQVERIAPQGAGGPRMMAARGEGVRIVKPGALLFASYDTDQNGRITRAEVDAGAQRSFTLADTNKDGEVAGFEQTAWAESVGSIDDVLTNPMSFDVNLDKRITPAEFASGLRRLAGPLEEPGGNGDILYTALIQGLNRSQEQAERGPPPGGPGGFAGGPPPRNASGGN